MTDQTTPSAAHLDAPASDFLAGALKSIANAVFITDCNGTILWCNDAFSRLCGYSTEELVGNSPALLKSGMQSASFYADLWAKIRSAHTWRGVLIDRRKDGSLYKVDQTITPLLDAQGNVAHFIAIQNDVAPPSPKAERERFLAYHDVLTELPNRVLFLELQERAIEYAKHKHGFVATMFLDLDGFKPVNDTYGHDIGDKVLQAVADRLRSSVRRTDTVARMGGDEFAVLVPDLEHDEIALSLARKLVTAIAQPFKVEQHHIHLGVSIGISIYPQDAEAGADLLKRADQAMYEAKSRGGGYYCRSGEFHSTLPELPYAPKGRRRAAGPRGSMK